jgi:small subunit ribosomal protein S4
MARIKAKAKLSRRVGRNLFLKGARSFSIKDDYSKRPFKPTKNGSRKPSSNSSSEYSKQLLEKQSIKYTYGIMEKQLINVFKKAFRQEGDTGNIALTILEKRLDNVVYRAGLSNSRSQARQLVNHGHFLVNGKKVNIPSYQIKSGDIIEVKENKTKNAFWTNFQLEVPNESPSWLDSSSKQKIKILNLPIKEDLPQDFNISSVVEYYSNKVA